MNNGKQFLIVCILLDLLVCLAFSSPLSKDIANGNVGIRESRRVKRRHRARADKRPPWQINQDVCPPSLCGPGGSDAVGFVPDGRNPEDGPAKFPFFEGDIVLDTDLRSRMGRGKRAVIRPISHLWQYGIIPYRIDPSFNGASKKVIRQALEVYQNETCIQFQRRDGDRDYIQFSNEPGCWSFVGKRNIGVQKIGMGDGCIQLGTVLHELGHALGFWHEQSRADRDEYIEIVERNVANRYIDQFDKRLKNESTTRGFPYDYKSIMHYGKTDFSLNGKPTLKVQGVGEELGVKIGQRKKLSDIDIAQIKDIYYCNQKDARDKGIACDPEWVKYEGHCYRFETQVRGHYSAAVSYCNDEDAHLLHIESEEEDRFIKQQLIEHYSHEEKWRVGAKRRDDHFIWFDGRRGHDSKPMRYTAWAPSYPRTFTTMTLERFDGTPPRFVWKAGWAGTAAKEKFALPFICEKPLPTTKCFRSESGTGSEYRGYLSYTTDYVTCQRWTEQYPHEHSTLTGNRERDTELGLVGHNYCRNPRGRRQRPWCYTTKADVEWQYCDVILC